MSTATLEGHRVTRARVHLPAWGIWWSEVSIDEEATLAGRVSLLVADLALSGTVMSGGPGPGGRSSFRIAGGAGSWGRSVPARSYANDAGVKAAIVLADAATACGEVIDGATLPATRLGPAFARELGPAARVLEQVAPGAWYVGQDGTTRIGKRARVTFAAPATVRTVDRARGTVEFAAESIAAAVPGAVIEGVEAVDVLHELTPSAIRSTLWGSGIAASSRRLTALRRLFEQLDPRARYRGIFEYRTVTQEAERLNLQPIRASAGMPDLQRVPVRPGVSGARADVAIGSRVLVAFVDGEPSRPVVVGFEDAEGEGFSPFKLELDATAELDLGKEAILTKIAGGLLGAARQTDPVVAGPFAGTIVGGSLRTRIG